MTIVQRFNNSAALLAALAAGLILLAATGAHAGNRGHSSSAKASTRVANSPPIIAMPGHDKHHGHHHRLGFGFAQAYWLVDSPCVVRRVRVDRDTEIVTIRRLKNCNAARAQALSAPGY